MNNYSVYVHIFPNGKQYVGISTNPIKRWRKNGKGYIDHTEMYKDIVYFGWDNIQHIILYSGLTKKQASEIEHSETIRRKSHLPKYGYNISVGNSRYGKDNPMFGMKGKQSPVAKTVYQYEKPSGEYVNSYESSLDAAIQNNIENHISECCKGSRISCGGYYWSFEKHKNYKPQKRKHNHANNKAVLQFDTNMNLLNTYSSIKDAENALNITNIGRACIQKYRTAGGFKWRYADVDS